MRDHHRTSPELTKARLILVFTVCLVLLIFAGWWMFEFSVRGGMAFSVGAVACATAAFSWTLKAHGRTSDLAQRRRPMWWIAPLIALSYLTAQIASHTMPRWLLFGSGGLCLAAAVGFFAAGLRARIYLPTDKRRSTSLG